MGYPAPVPTIDFYAGDDFTQRYDLTQADAPFPLTGWTSWAAQWRAVPASDTALPIGLVIDAAAGTITITFTGATVRSMGSPGVWDIQAVAGDGTLRTWLRGKTTWQLDVTRV